MSDREEEMGRLAAREQESEDVDTEQEDTVEGSEGADDNSTFGFGYR